MARRIKCCACDHGESVLKCRRKGHAVAQGATCGSTRVGQEVEGARRKCGQGLLSKREARGETE